VAAESLANPRLYAWLVGLFTAVAMVLAMAGIHGSHTMTDMRLDGKVAIVTGATKGVGRGIVRELARQGSRVFVTGRSAPDHERIDERITGIRCDHRIDAQVEAAFNLILREVSAIDILVNNVWGGYEGMVEDGNFTWLKPFWEQPLWRWDAMFDAGVRAYYQASRLVLLGHKNRHEIPGAVPGRILEE
jgi:NAD(P)-dependent dehydrogenase (short-subunit alcohol dehydrogenase family)